MPRCWCSGLTPSANTRTRSIAAALVFTPSGLKVARRNLAQPNGSRLPFIFASTWFTSGRVRAAPRISPSRSAMKPQRSSITGFRSLACARTSSSVIGTKPQFFSQAEL